jgi:hypothetical protein
LEVVPVLVLVKLMITGEQPPLLLLVKLAETGALTPTKENKDLL